MFQLELYNMIDKDIKNWFSAPIPNNLTFVPLLTESVTNDIFEFGTILLHTEFGSIYTATSNIRSWVEWTKILTGRFEIANENSKTYILFEKEEDMVAYKLMWL